MANNAHVTPAKGAKIPLKNIYEPIAKQGSGSNDKYSERLIFGSLSRASGYSIARNKRDREPIPLTPEILHLLDKLEPDNGKPARLLTEHATRHKQLPSTEQELQQMLKKRV